MLNTIDQYKDEDPTCVILLTNIRMRILHVLKTIDQYQDDDLTCVKYY